MPTSGGPLPADAAVDLLLLAPLSLEFSIGRRGLREEAGSVDRLGAKAARGWWGQGSAVMVQGGVGGERTIRNLSRAIERVRPRAVLLFGLAGGLDPALRPGTIVLGRPLLGPDRSPVPATGFLRLAGAQEAPIVTVDRLVESVEEKRRLFEETGAAAVDLESSYAASVCARYGVGFDVLRAICDDAQTPLDSRLLDCVRPDGSLRLARWLRVVGRPSRWPSLSRLAWAAVVARRALELALTATRAPNSLSEP